MDSIREKLDLALIVTLIVTAFLFASYMIVLIGLGFSLTPEAYAQIVSAMATTLVVIFTLGLRLIDDTLNRYENYAKGRISGLKSVLGSDATRSELERYEPVNLPARSKDLARTATELVRHGRFFLIKLYPQEALDKILEIYHNLKRFLELVDELEPYREGYEVGYFLRFLISGDSDDKVRPDGSIIKKGKLSKARKKLEEEKPQLMGQISTLREKLLQEIDDAMRGLDSFLEAN